jgi:hypothetical protein
MPVTYVFIDFSGLSSQLGTRMCLAGWAELSATAVSFASKEIMTPGYAAMHQVFLLQSRRTLIEKTLQRLC